MAVVFCLDLSFVCSLSIDVPRNFLVFRRALNIATLSSASSLVFAIAFVVVGLGLQQGPSNSSSLLNPVSGLCADAPDGIAAQPGDHLRLTKCGQPNSSQWVLSTVDGTLSQHTHVGAYPG